MSIKLKSYGFHPIGKGAKFQFIVVGNTIDISGLEYHNKVKSGTNGSDDVFARQVAQREWWSNF